MNKFKVGDKVAIYGCDENGNAIRIVSRVTGDLGNGIYYTDEDTSHLIGHYDLSMVHEKQCRKIVTVKGKRRVYICERHLKDTFLKGGSNLFHVTTKHSAPDDVEFVEVRKKSK